MTNALDTRREEVADDAYAAYDFSPYQVEDSDGWQRESTDRGRYDKVVYLVPPREDGSGSDIDTDPSSKATFTVIFASGTAEPSEVYASLNGDTVGHPGTGVEPPVTPALALQAILARIDGRFDDPALVRFGALQPDRLEDIAHIAREGLKTAEAA